jgi:glycerol transport system substrate-binding protein
MISVFFCFRNIAPHNCSISFLLTVHHFHLIVYADVAETMSQMGGTIMKLKYLVTAAALALAITAGPSFADVEAAKKWIDTEFQPSALSKEDQLKEMEWFIKAAEPFKGMEINVLSEGIPTHDYESKVLTKAFEEITGIKVNHQILGEGEVVQAVQTQMQTNRNLYDGYVNDSDLIGTHSRLQQTYNLTDMMAGDWKDVTNPGLDLNDFIGIKFTTGPDGKLYQLPDQQFANLYWFRKDWFDRQDLKDKFKAKYGYELGVPVNWSAYEDIAQFFTEDVKEIDGVRIFGHMDYGKRAPAMDNQASVMRQPRSGARLP